MVMVRPHLNHVFEVSNHVVPDISIQCPIRQITSCMHEKAIPVSNKFLEASKTWFRLGLT